MSLRLSFKNNKYFEKPKIECHRCGYKWKTKSKLKTVTCPSCGRKTPNLSV